MAKLASKRSKRDAPVQPAQHAESTVGVPQMPAMYQGKKRDTFLPWSHAEDRLARSRNYWICTSRADGRPHSAPVWGFWHDGALYFGTHRDSRKARNIARNRHVSVHLESGDDVVIVEGVAEEVDQKALARQLEAVCRKKYGMPMSVMPESVSFRVRPRVVLAWTETDFPNNATRWEFRDQRA
jgi:nitroimidazol reductase NimA-like FMN-containing flavoprotein (pyridoxamine 5'-phosphate oxidase superfamily)